jgi:hypothetical protein
MQRADPYRFRADVARPVPAPGAGVASGGDAPGLGKQGLTHRNRSFTLVVPCDAGWSSLVARRAHNPKVAGSNPAPAIQGTRRRCRAAF